MLIVIFALPQLKALQSAQGKVSAALQLSEKTGTHYFAELTNLAEELEWHSQRLLRDPNTVTTLTIASSTA